MTETYIDLRSLLVEREEFEGSMVSKLREGLAQGGPQVRALKEINDTLAKKLTTAQPAQAKKLHLKLGVVHFYLGHMPQAIEQLSSPTARSVSYEPRKAVMPRRLLQRLVRRLGQLRHERASR